MFRRSTGDRSLRSRGRWTTTPASVARARALGEDHIDRVVLRPGDAPQVSGRAVRRHRAGTGTEHRGGDALLTGVGRSDEAGDAGMQRLEQSGVDRSVPRRHATCPDVRPPPS